ncbi:hypothetical protein MIND_01333600 [Mycena indigotica]|uniref:Uncharacterized protein n=1 Tax=Mycena indigotica TaxID=2126181 RepID=A0A8H6S1M3_9AGAR|nr:uncharacterized protein MIND_01333600 [Mycena indigotica]KAF7290202.1 hypothetical protein MIND_01333600 [Mycena indigotica]
MHFSLTTALSALFLASSAYGVAQIHWHIGADCTGELLGTHHSILPGDCLSFDQGRSARSVSWEEFYGEEKIQGLRLFQSGGANDGCAGDFQLESNSTSGCVTAPPGVNWQSVKLT